MNDVGVVFIFPGLSWIGEKRIRFDLAQTIISQLLTGRRMYFLLCFLFCFQKSPLLLFYLSFVDNQ